MSVRIFYLFSLNWKQQRLLRSREQQLGWWDAELSAQPLILMWKNTTKPAGSTLRDASRNQRWWRIPACTQLLFHNLPFARDFLIFFLTLSACSSLSNPTLLLHLKSNLVIIINQMIDDYLSQNKDMQLLSKTENARICYKKHISVGAPVLFRIEMRWVTSKWCNGAWEAFMLTRIDAKMGVLMIHQDISVLSMMSQHLAGKEIKFKWRAVDVFFDPAGTRFSSYPMS